MKLNKTAPNWPRSILSTASLIWLQTERAIRVPLYLIFELIKLFSPINADKILSFFKNLLDALPLNKKSKEIFGRCIGYLINILIILIVITSIPSILDRLKPLVGLPSNEALQKEEEHRLVIFSNASICISQNKCNSGNCLKNVEDALVGDARLQELKEMAKASYNSNQCSPSISPCERESQFENSRAKGFLALSEYVDECKNSTSKYVILGKSILNEEETSRYNKARACLERTGCSAFNCILEYASRFASIDNLDKIIDTVSNKIKSGACIADAAYDEARRLSYMCGNDVIWNSEIKYNRHDLILHSDKFSLNFDISIVGKSNTRLEINKLLDIQRKGITYHPPESNVRNIYYDRQIDDCGTSRWTNADETNFYDLPTPERHEYIQPGGARDFIHNNNNIVYFLYSSFELDNRAQEQLSKIATWILRYNRSIINIEGHKDEHEYDAGISLKRASVVRDYLESLGVNRSRIKVRDLGSSSRAATCDSEQCAQMNQRVVIVITRR